MMTGFSTAPLQLASLIGFGCTLFGIAVFLYVVVRYCLEGSVPGFPFLASIIAIFSGAQLFASGRDRRIPRPHAFSDDESSRHTLFVTLLQRKIQRRRANNDRTTGFDGD